MHKAESQRSPVGAKCYLQTHSFLEHSINSQPKTFCKIRAFSYVCIRAASRSVSKGVSPTLCAGKRLQPPSQTRPKRTLFSVRLKHCTVRLPSSIVHPKLLPRDHLRPCFWACPPVLPTSLCPPSGTNVLPEQRQAALILGPPPARQGARWELSPRKRLCPTSWSRRLGRGMGPASQERLSRPRWPSGCAPGHSSLVETHCVSRCLPGIRGPPRATSSCPSSHTLPAEVAGREGEPLREAPAAWFWSFSSVLFSLNTRVLPTAGLSASPPIPDAERERQGP